MAASSSLLDIVSTCHNYPFPLFTSPTSEQYHAFHLHLSPTTAQIGFLTREVFAAIRDDDSGTFCIEEQDPAQSSASRPAGLARVGLNPSLNDFKTRSQALNAVVRRWKEAGLFKGALDGWRDEQYAIYASTDEGEYRSWSKATRGNTSPNPPAFELERAACALLGLATYGVHLTAYTTDGDLRVWTPRRAATKATWPSYLDNSVAGGITSGDKPRESMIRECWEEAGLTDDVVRPRLKQVGVITYVYRTPEGYIQPEVEYVYDLPLPADIIPKPIDGEAEDFQLLDVRDVRTKMEHGEFKPNCALVIIDFLIRHGIITAEDEPRYQEVVRMLHNDLGLPGP